MANNAAETKLSYKHGRKPRGGSRKNNSRTRKAVSGCVRDASAGDAGLIGLFTQERRDVHHIHAGLPHGFDRGIAVAPVAEHHRFL
jgi:hypothetical protein